MTCWLNKHGLIGIWGVNLVWSSVLEDKLGSYECVQVWIFLPEPWCWRKVRIMFEYENMLVVHPTQSSKIEIIFGALDTNFFPLFVGLGDTHKTWARGASSVFMSARSTMTCDHPFQTPEKKDPSVCILSVGCFNQKNPGGSFIFYIFIPHLGKISPFWRSYVSDGLVQPPTRKNGAGWAPIWGDSESTLEEGRIVRCEEDDMAWDSPSDDVEGQLRGVFCIPTWKM